MDQLRPSSGTIIYLTMDLAIDPAIPTYSGGLGILAGDMVRSAADLGLPMIAVTLLNREGYCEQQLDSEGNQMESPMPWRPEEHLEPLLPRVSICIEGREVKVRAWQYSLQGITGHMVPVLFLDTDLDENDAWDRRLTDQLYGGDNRYRLCQEVVLGYGGVGMIEVLGYRDVQLYHLNEGHCAFASLALLEPRPEGHHSDSFSVAQIEAVRRRCVFTTHTPVPAGHDRFSADLVGAVLGTSRLSALQSLRVLNGDLNMSELALRMSGYVNGVSMRHGEVSRTMFPTYAVDAITNGVHAATWTSAPFAALYDNAIPQWRKDNCHLRYAIGLPLDRVRAAHAEAKKELLREIRWLTGVQLDEKIFTLGFARRATPYKRANLLFSDLERLKSIARDTGPLQVVYAGKAHPRDDGGKAIIRRIFEAAAALANDVRVVYLPNYDMALGKVICSGVDVWLNTPLKPQEASGTSGMKAALNGVPSLSVLDGWWIEGHIEGITGWCIGEANGPENDANADALSLYQKLQTVILPLFYKNPEKFSEVMRSTIAFNGSFFNTQRMIFQYLRNAYAGIGSNGVLP
jgi:glycogen phosphorylase